MNIVNKTFLLIYKTNKMTSSPIKIDKHPYLWKDNSMQKSRVKKEMTQIRLKKLKVA